MLWPARKGYRFMPNSENRDPNWWQRLLEGDLRGCLARIILDVGYVFMYAWVALAVILLGISTWALFVADPAIMAPGSLNRNSSTAEKVAATGFMVLLVALGVGGIFLIRHLRRGSRRR